MTRASPDSTVPKSASREVLLVLAFTVIGGVIRLWNPQHLGLVHFDEGIYALAGLWPFAKGGLAAIDPTVIAYAPPGFPVLIGLSYLVLGISDLAAILVSVAMGTLTIPLSAWLARRTFGAGAGAAAAALIAFSGAHVAFSRMALTDASFLFFWTLGLICSQRFLEHPGLLTALALGASTGLAQLFKYNGWLIGSIVILAALLGIVADANERSRSRLAAVWGYGLLAALVAGVIYWPWFQFVESHGGYARLMAHHQSYMGGTRTWLRHFLVQIDQLSRLSDSPAWPSAATVGAIAGGFAVLRLQGSGRWLRGILLLLICAAILVGPALLYGFVLFVYPLVRIPRGARERLLILCWLSLTLLTPLYHPYARLWLPVYLVSLVLFAGLLCSILEGDSYNGLLARSPTTRGLIVVFGLMLIRIVFEGVQDPRRFHRDLPGPLAGSDSVRHAVVQARADLPQGTLGVRLLVRPPVTFYLGGKVPTKAESNLAGMMEAGNPGHWALVDLAMLRQEPDHHAVLEILLSHWELVHEYPTQLNLPTLLDVDPGAATSGRSEAVNAPLWLLRPRAARTSQ